jgi:Nif-specific regulatory protein
MRQTQISAAVAFADDTFEPVAAFGTAPLHSRQADSRAARLDARVRFLAAECDPKTGCPRVAGVSREWHEVLKQATQVAPAATTVLLLGESGTGKEVVARFIHRASSRDRGPFVAINCAALPEHLLEAELFGFERGAFTGATQSKPGQIELAAGGTLFLDEIGEMSPQAQAKLLRVLQEREFQRLGGTRMMRADVRIIAATNRNLEQAIACGQFREDLYYRLNIFPIRLPALRDRRDDILPLAQVFLTLVCRELSRPAPRISRDAERQLVGYHWPGNARELRNALERAAIVCDDDVITVAHLSLNVPSPSPIKLVLNEAAAANAVAALPASAGDLRAMERTFIERALQQARFY